MYFKITNSELLVFINEHGNLKDKSVKLITKFSNVAKIFKESYCLKADVKTLQLTLKQVFEVKNKDEEWLATVRSFETEVSEPVKKRERKSAGRPASTLQDCPSKNVETRILKEGLESVAAIARKQGIEKEALLTKLVQEACRSYEWDMAEFLSSLNVSSPVPINELTALFHVANLSQRQYQMCRNLLVCKIWC